MSRGELWTRTQQGFFKRWDSLFSQSQLRSPKDVPATWVKDNDMPRFFFDSEDIPDLVNLLRGLLPEQALRITRQADRICQHRFDLLGYENLDYGPVIDWHLDAVSGKRAPRKSWYKVPYLRFSEVGDHKVIWELNRHQHFVTLAKAFCLSGNERYVHELCEQWYQWHDENPYPIGINWASSLEVAFRTLSWLWVRQLLGKCPLLPASFQADLLKALTQNGRHISRYLSSYFSPNTHLLGEGAALYFLGTVCPQIHAASDWQTKGWDIILEAAERQVQADGMHFEQSIYYHVYALDLLLHSRILAARNQRSIPRSLDQKIEMMAEVLSVLGQTGVPPRIGDDDGGRVFDPTRHCTEQMLDPLSTAAVVFRRADFKAVSKSLREETLWLLGAEGAVRFSQLATDSVAIASRAFYTSGIYIMASEELSTQLVARAGPMGAMRAGHSHCDSLSIHLSVGGKEVLGDPGTFRYVDDAGERNRFRGTAAHNTLRIDCSDQAEARDLFSWNFPPPVRVERWIPGRTFDLLTAAHSGYRRLISPATHRRWVFHLKTRFWLVRDEIEGDGHHLLEMFWHLAPGLVWQTNASNSVLASDSSGSSPALMLLSAEGHSWSRNIINGWYSPAYGRKMRSSVLEYRTKTVLPADFATILYPGEMPSVYLVKLEANGSLEHGSNVVGYRYEDAGENHFFFFAEGGKPWTWQGWASDAAFLYCRMTPSAELAHAILCEGSFAEINHRRVLTTQRHVSRCEWIGPSNSTRVWCSDEDTIDFPGHKPQSVSEMVIPAAIQENPQQGSN